MTIPHPVIWTPAAIARFWDLYESTPGMDLWHFSRQRGRALLRCVAKHCAITEPVLDLGSGSGHLLKLLLDRNVPCFAADVSKKGVAIVEKRFAGQPGFLGARAMESADTLPFNDSAVGTVFLLETIEHLLPETLAALLSEIPRVLVKNGRLVITTPWQEDLGAASLTCAGCGCTFHKTQHLRSYDDAGVRAIVECAGFRTVSCKPALLLPDISVWVRAQMTPAHASVACPECAALCTSTHRSLFARWKSLTHELKHLVCIAQKR